MNCCRETAKMGRAPWEPQGVGAEAYLNGTSQGPTPEDARKDGPYPRSQQVIHEISGLGIADFGLRILESMEHRA